LTRRSFPGGFAGALSGAFRCETGFSCGGASSMFSRATVRCRQRIEGFRQYQGALGDARMGFARTVAQRVVDAGM